MSKAMLVLASQSKARKAMLEAAGISIEAYAPHLDEEVLKYEMSKNDASAPDLAQALANAKAVSLYDQPGLILGGDQILEMADGSMLDKPVDRDNAKNHLHKLSGTTHKLHSAAAIAKEGTVIWHHADIATLTMRYLSDAFIDQYVETEWENIRHCVGCYEIEGRGVQLFSDIEGSQFTVMGLPLLPLLDYLRVIGAMRS